MQNPPHRINPIHILHDIKLAHTRPVLIIPSIIATQSPECRPVPDRFGAFDIGHQDPRLDPHLAAFLRHEVGPLSFDSCGCPDARGAVEEGRYLEDAVAGQLVGLLVFILLNSNKIFLLVGNWDLREEKNLDLRVSCSGYWCMFGSLPCPNLLGRQGRKYQCQ